LRDVEVLFQGLRDEARQQGIVEGGPPDCEVCLVLNLPTIDILLPEEA